MGNNRVIDVHHIVRLPGDLDSHPNSSKAVDKSSPCPISSLRVSMVYGRALNHCGMCIFRGLSKRSVKSDSPIKINYSTDLAQLKVLKANKMVQVVLNNSSFIAKDKSWNPRRKINPNQGNCLKMSAVNMYLRTHENFNQIRIKCRSTSYSKQWKFQFFVISEYEWLACTDYCIATGPLWEIDRNLVGWPCSFKFDK